MKVSVKNTAGDSSVFLTLVKSPIRSVELSSLSSSFSMSAWQKDLDLWNNEQSWKETRERLRKTVDEKFGLTRRNTFPRSRHETANGF